jgi:hypothetical protein
MTILLQAAASSLHSLDFDFPGLNQYPTILTPSPDRFSSLKSEQQKPRDSHDSKPKVSFRLFFVIQRLKMVQPTTPKRRKSVSIATIVGIAICVFFVGREAFEGGWVDFNNYEALDTRNSQNSDGGYSNPTAQEVSFYEVGLATSTDKVAAPGRLPGCLENDATCTRPSCVREECRPWGHYYHTMYQQKFGKMTLPGTEPFQFLEIGFVS